MAHNGPVTGSTPITIKISVGEEVKKLKLPFRELTADVLPARLISVLGLPTDKKVVFERFSDSVGSFITLDAANPAVYKTLARAAKAKLKLRLRAVIEGEPLPPLAMPATQPKITTADILARPDIAATLARLPHATDRVQVFQDAQKSKNYRTPMSGSGRNNIGAGIFEFKDSLATGVKSPVAAAPPQQTASALAQAQSFLDAYGTDMKSFTSQCEPVLVFRRKPSADGIVAPKPVFSVYCNECDATLNNEHFHCSICDGGDYDLCQRCVDGGKLCPGDNHWLVKRSVQNGMIISSTTERLPPKPKALGPIACALPVRLHMGPPSPEKIVPGAFADETKTLRDEDLVSSRTCNSCIDVLADDKFVTCLNCEDFDLCMRCHEDDQHGHHPGHEFGPACEGQTLNDRQKRMLTAGRNVPHMAICDGCNMGIFGIRHKCFDCPDFDYCNNCVGAADQTHPGHRFAPLYKPIGWATTSSQVVHRGVYCDGAACSSKPRQGCITGVRYKCVVCNDTDFCASCEALPNNSHNSTHPLIKIKSPIRGLSIATVNDRGNGNVVSTLGDRPSPPRYCPFSSSQGPIPGTAAAAMERPPPIYSSASTSTFNSASSSVAPTASASAQTWTQNSSTSVRTVASVEPTPVKEEKKEQTASETFESKPATVKESELQALFVCDTIPDGITVRGDTRFTQVWTMRNPGPRTWPAGCSVRLTGGDNMLNVDRERPFSAAAMTEATESNVIGREVLPGEEVSFKVILRAPHRGGKAISYWRLKTADGTAFGHRLWCDINVRASEEYAPKLFDTTKAVEAQTEPTPKEQAETPMVFPTLEKESPSSSLHLSRSSQTPQELPAVAKVATVEDEATGDVVSAAVVHRSTGIDVEDELLEEEDYEIDVLSATDEASDDDGFLTDEEYDILDASDQETVASSSAFGN